MAKDRRKKNIKKFLFILFLIVLAILGTIVGIIYSKLSNLNIKDIDISKLSVNDDLYNKIAGDMSERDFRNVKNFVLFGIDTQGKGDGQEDGDFIGRSDTIMIVSINPKYKSIKLISIPRDTYVDVEGHGKTKINHAYAYGGVELALKTINENFDLNITEFATIDFSGLVNIINDIDGINVNITESEKNYINQYSFVIYDISGNDQKYLYSYGNTELDGEQALTHSRNRTIGDGDFERARRQRDVLDAIFLKISKMDAGEIYGLVDVFFKEIVTNVDVSSYMGTLGEILLNKSTYLSNIVSTQVPKEGYCEHKTIDGIYYFVPTDTERMKEEMLEYIYKR